MRDTIIFDVDGTLLDSETIYMETWVSVGADFGYTISRDVLLKTRGISAPVVKQVFMEHFGEDFPYDAIVQRRRALIDERFQTTPAEDLQKPYALQTLQTLKSRGYTLAVASSNPYEKICQRLALAGLYEFFDSVICGDMVQRSKPAPDIFLKAAESVNAAPAQCLVVGDTPADVLGATAAGMPVILIPDHVPVTPETAALSLQVLPDLSQVPQIIEHLDP